MRKYSIVFLMALTLPINARAADKSNNFAAKGHAAVSCASFVEERSKSSQAYAETMAWLTGYISAYNYLKPDTYDVVPWQSVDLLSSLLASHCAGHPDESFLLAANRVIGSLAEDRLRSSSDIITVTVGDYRLNMYKDVVFRIQAALKEKGYLKARWGTGDYDGPTADAMKAFQAGNKLEATGVPDQQSLLMLFTK